MLLDVCQNNQETQLAESLGHESISPNYTKLGFWNGISVIEKVKGFRPGLTINLHNRRKIAGHKTKPTAR
jgi:hypothetical protein